MNTLVAKIKQLLSTSKLSRDLVWTGGSFAILAVSGVLINIVIAWFRDATSLGVFNLSYSVYIIASQVAVAGVHYSILYHTAYYSDDSKKRNTMLWTAIIMALLTGVIVALGIYSLSDIFGKIFGSPQTAQALKLVALGLLLFPVNKVLISYVNGMRHMRAFSLFQSARYLLVMGWVTFLSVSEMPFYYALLAFFVAEVFTVIATFCYLVFSGLLRSLSFSLEWCRKHLHFGSKSFVAGMFLEINTRVDVLLIGAFLTEKAVGIYSFAAMLVDGVYHILAIVRVNFNPILVETIRDKHWDQGQKLLAQSKSYLFAAIAILCVLIITVFYIGVQYLMADKGLMEGMVPLIILLSSMVLISAFVPFDHILMTGGYPVYQTIQNFSIVMTNVVLNIALVPKFGIEGAAIATALSYITGVLVMNFYASKLLGWNLLRNQRIKMDS